jgi:ABC-type transport system involved in cytochrome bd biosynthesis fused ATPase/permease subunit
VVSWHGFLFRGIGKFWHNLRMFAYYNKTIVELFFIFLYASEQAALIWITFNLKVQLGYIVSLFALVVLTTFALQKVIMESRIRILENEVNKIVKDERVDLKSEFESLSKGYYELLGLYSKNLKINNTNNIKKRVK